jgi:hypothetical protein
MNADQTKLKKLSAFIRVYLRPDIALPAAEEGG